MTKDKKKASHFDLGCTCGFYKLLLIYLKAILSAFDTTSAKDNLETCPSIVHYFNFAQDTFYFQASKE